MPAARVASDEATTMQITSSAGALPLGQFLSPPLQPEAARRPTVRSARSRNRAAAWSYDLAQWREYQTLSHPTRGPEIEAEYARLEAAGPDFTRYHSGSAFAEAPLHSISREDRVRMLQAFDTVRAGLYRHGRKKQGQAVSRTYRDVLGIILSFAVKHGRAYPSLTTIARAAMCSTRTVLRALAWLELFGFLGRIRRLARVRTPLGMMACRQTSNAYRITTRLAGLGAMAMNVFAGRERHNFTPSIEKAHQERRGQDSRYTQFSNF